MRSVRSFVVTALICGAVPLPSRAQPVTSTEQAAGFYDAGLRYAAQKDWAAARVAFEQAYALAPHADVLVNLVVVSIELSDESKARRYLTEYLAGLGPNPSEAEQSRSKQLIERVRELEATKSAAASSVESPAPAADSTRPGVNASTSEQQNAPQGTPGASQRAAPLRVDPPASRSKTPATAVKSSATSGSASAVGYALGAVGAALALGSGALWWWNNDRYSQATTEREALLRDPAPSAPRDQAELAALLQYTQAAAENNAAFSSIHQFDTLAVVTSSVAAGLLLTGAYLVVFGETEQSHVIATGQSLHLSLRF